MLATRVSGGDRSASPSKWANTASVLQPSVKLKKGGTDPRRAIGEPFYRELRRCEIFVSGEHWL